MAKLGSGRSALILFICGIIGFLLAMVEYMLYENEWIIQNYTTASELTALMGITVLIWIIIGVVLAAIFQ